MKRTLLFGGSFDPIHNGHIEISKLAKEELNIDSLIFILAKAPRWKNPEASDKERLDMLSLAIEDIEGASISLIEINSDEEVNYTFNTIKKYPKEEGEILYYLIGYDQLDKLDKWYEIDKLSKEVQIVAYPRPDYLINEENVKRFNVILLKSQLTNDMSSTKARSLIDLDIPEKVLKYIEEHNLYYIKKVHSYLSEHRFKHTLSVANLAYKVAKANHLDYTKAYIAALLHDIGKEIDKEEQLEFIEKNYSEYINDLTPPLYHQFLSFEIAKKEFSINDEIILNAIKYHATGSDEMDEIGKIVYASDKVEPTRHFETKPYIDELILDFEKGFRMVLNANIDFLIETGKDFSNSLTFKCVKKYIGRNI